MADSYISVDTQLAEIYTQVLETNERIQPFILHTPLERSLALSALSGAEVYLKCEHLQHTGSFKLRGALSKLTRLTKNSKQINVNVIAASTGNHGLGVAYAAKQLNVLATIYLPKATCPIKQDAIRDLGARIALVDGDGLLAEMEARSRSEATGQHFISPYNDLDVIAGQGTIGCELQHVRDIAALFVSVGGGGLISGIGAYLKSVNPATKLIGCWPENAPAMFECLQAGKIVDVPEKLTLSTSTAGGLEANSVTFALCQRLIDDYICVSEQEIVRAMRLIAEHERWMIEGAAAVAVAAFMKACDQYRGKKVAILLCGRNLSLAQFREVFV